MLIPVRIEVKCRRIRHVATSVIGNNRDVISDLGLVRITFKWVKHVAYLYVSRPRNSGIGAGRIEQLRIGVIGSVTRVIPNSIQPPIRRYRERAEPMPFTGINRIVIDLVRRAEG